MKWLLIHFVPWFVIPLLVYHLTNSFEPELFPIVVIGFIVIILIYYITQFMRKWLPLPLSALILSTLLYYYLLM